MVAGGFVPGVLQIPQQRPSEMSTLRIEDHSVSKRIVCSLVLRYILSQLNFTRCSFSNRVALTRDRSIRLFL